MAAAPQFTAKILRRATPDEYRVYRAGLEWDLTDPIVIETRDDVKSEARWRDRVEPYHHQITNLITFCRRLPVTLLADDVGLGKTISAGLIASELISRGRLSKILIVCPKLLGPQWQEELLSKFGIESIIATGQELIDADPVAPGAVITTYASARVHLEKLPEDRFQMLILDEAHKLRNLYGVDPPPKVAKRFRHALEQRRFRFVLMLTATPIQNRLWDLYSLVDLLTVARGHENPFGSEGLFARRFIADRRDQARQLKFEAREEFRSIVYGYMSRIRRGDAKLYFPDRVVQMHRVPPTRDELALIDAIAKPIQDLNRLAQISILQALTSSPDALMAQLNNMAKKGTVPQELAAEVRAIVTRMPTSAKLKGLGTLIANLIGQNPERWRLIVFTTRLETQTTIQLFLENLGLKVGTINGDSGARNQETLRRFRANPPDLHVIVSTEAGSEGVNLQVANVLVNFDLPWNPMIVEQRIGRVQRLASEHAKVAIFNIILEGTFEEYIVGRLMEKLQMASHAIGDIEALLQASGVGDTDKETAGFDEQIRQLVVAALAGKNVEEDTRQREESIAKAKETLEQEENNINSMLGSMDGAEHVGPRAPKLPQVERSMNYKPFTLAALESLGARVREQPGGIYLAEQDGGREYFRFDESAVLERKTTLYAPGTAAFARLVGRTIATGVHEVTDLDTDAGRVANDLAKGWVEDFGARLSDAAITRLDHLFDGNALVRTQASVAHDSYERLVSVSCPTGAHRQTGNARAGLAALGHTIESPGSIGVDDSQLVVAAERDQAIAEFCRFYLERRAQEVQAAGNDERKRKKLEDEFTPRLAMTLVALGGQTHREIQMRVRYRFDDETEYTSTLTAVPHLERLTEAPGFGDCAISGRKVPLDCLKSCAISGDKALGHLLVASALSSRVARPEHAVICGLTGKRILQDEAEASAVTGKPVARALLKTSAMSGKRAEPNHFGQCGFTNVEVLNTELAVSEISGKRYRSDEQMRSAVSGKVGHKQEFIHCHETRQPLLSSEAETCEVTGNKVRPGILEACTASGKRVLPAELERCAVTGKMALRRHLVTSSQSPTRMLEEQAIRSGSGKFCTLSEADTCMWSGRRCHPEDMRSCELTGLSVHAEFTTSGLQRRLRSLGELLDGMRRSAEGADRWQRVTTAISSALRISDCRVEAATLSPDAKHLAVSVEARTLLGLRKQHAGFVYSVSDDAIVGRVARGRRTDHGWARA